MCVNALASGMILVAPRGAALDGTLTASLQESRILLIRHGQTAWNVERRFLGRTDLPLDDTGARQAHRLGERLAGARFAAVWSSPLLRARQTAAPLGEPLLHAGLQEMAMGELEGLAGPEFAAKYPDLLISWRDAPHAVQLPGGEHLADVQARGIAAFREIVATVRPGTEVAIVTHQLVLATLVCHLAGAPFATFRSYMHRNTGITTIALTRSTGGAPAGAPRILTLDDATHLDGADAPTPVARPAR